MKRPETTLFLLISVDGKISTGDRDVLDVDKDLRKIVGAKEGLYQYYDLEKQTDPYSLNTGRVMAKIGLNGRTEKPQKIGCSFIIIDNHPHLQETGVRYLSGWVKTLYLVTTNKDHPAYKLSKELDNIVIINFEDKIDFKSLFEILKERYKIERITLQSGGTLNASLVREGLVDHLSVVITPVLIGGKDTSTLMDGESLHSPEEIFKIKVLKLISCKQLENSYIHLLYDVIQETKIEV